MDRARRRTSLRTAALILSALLIAACHPLVNPIDPQSTAYTGTPVGTEATTTQPLLPDVIRWQIVAEHAPSQYLAIDVNDAEYGEAGFTTESRMPASGMLRLVLTFSDPLELDEVWHSTTYVAMNVGGVSSVSIAWPNVNSVGTNQLAYEFSPPFDVVSIATVRVLLVDRNGTTIGTRSFGLLPGDINGDGVVDALDTSTAIVSRDGHTTDGSDIVSIRSDIDCNGIVEFSGTDGAAVTVFASYSLPGPPPALDGTPVTSSPWTVLYDMNGALSGTVPFDHHFYGTGDRATAMANVNFLLMTGSSFDGWNSAFDGSGTHYNVGDEVVVPAGGITLYAEWGPEFAGGDGSLANPYLVSSAEHLYNVRNHLTGTYFAQTADIDLGVEPWLTHWTPIGTSSTPFASGTYNGNRHAIRNMTMNVSTVGVGLFSYLNGATISGLRLENVAIVNHGTNTGGLAGGQTGTSSTLTQIGVTGTITADSTSPNTGGIIGFVSGLAVSEAYTDVAINAGYNVGGLLGNASSAIIADSYAIGPVTATGVSGQAGGLIGIMTAGKLTNVYSAGAVSAITLAGGVVGTVTGAPTFSGVYFDTQTSGQSASTAPNDGAFTTAQMTSQASFAVWSDWSTYWQIKTGSYPYLIWQGSSDIPYP